MPDINPSVALIITPFEFEKLKRHKDLGSALEERIDYFRAMFNYKPEYIGLTKECMIEFNRYFRQFCDVRPCPFNVGALYDGIKIIEIIL